MPSVIIILPSATEPLLLAELVANNTNKPELETIALTPGILAELIALAKPATVVTPEPVVTVIVLIVLMKLASLDLPLIIWLPLLPWPPLLP